MSDNLTNHLRAFNVDPADHSIADEMLERLRAENARLRKTILEIHRIALDTDTRPDVCCIAIHGLTFRALNPTEVDG